MPRHAPFYGYIHAEGDQPTLSMRFWGTLGLDFHMLNWPVRHVVDGSWMPFLGCCEFIGSPFLSQIWRLFFFSHGNSVVFFVLSTSTKDGIWISSLAGRWFGTWILWLSIQLGSSSSQVTKSIIFQRGGSTTNQKRLLTIINHILTIINSILTIRVGLNHQPAKLWNAPGYSDPRLWTCKAGESLVPWSEPVS